MLIIVQASYRYRIEPSGVQRSMLARTFGCCRVVAAGSCGCCTNRAGEKITPAEVRRRVITEAKTREERGWLAEVASVALVQSVRDAPARTSSTR
jgi:putative transposase